MTCRRCGGLMVENGWQTEEGEQGLDWRCLLCSHRLPIHYTVAYSPTRVCSPKGVAEA